MSVRAMITTICGAFIFPFLIKIMWAKFVELGGVIGGCFAALTIVGTMWIVNHGMNNHLIVQSGEIWIDMAWSAAIGIFVASVVVGRKIKKSFSNIGAAVVGGIFAGVILASIR